MANKRFEPFTVTEVQSEDRNGALITVTVRVAEPGRPAVYLKFGKVLPQPRNHFKVVKVLDRSMPDGTGNDSPCVSKGAFRKAYGIAKRRLHPTKHTLRVDALAPQPPAWLRRADCGDGN